MDSLRALVERKWVLAVGALVAGLALGLLYGWVIDPVEWVNATPEQLRADLQQDYLRMVIESYSVNHDAPLALERYRALGVAGPEVLAAVAAQPGELDPTAIQRFRAAIEILEPETPAPEEGGGLPSGAASRFILPVCGVAVALGILLLLALLIRRRMESGGLRQVEGIPPFEMPSEAELGYAATGEPSEREPLAAFRTTYTLGDDLYDDSFSIETPAGDFVGECGVGIGDIIGVGEPKKVSAFEVWLFDKNDIQTVTKVLMSRYAFHDDTTRNRLAAKGDPIEAESGGVAYLETAALEVEARIVDMTYGQGPLPQGSYFERMTIELRAWARAGGPM
ncbi:MAG: hypothetical protein AB1449_05155 [Chloroflexota bacterium]